MDEVKDQSQQTTQAEVTVPVKGKLAIGLNHPTPKWAVYIVRGLVWFTGAWITMGLAGTLTDMGVSPVIVERVGKIMPIIAAGASIASRYLGIKPPDDIKDTDPLEVSSPQANDAQEMKSD